MCTLNDFSSLCEGGGGSHPLFLLLRHTHTESNMALGFIKQLNGRPKKTFESLPSAEGDVLTNVF